MCGGDLTASIFGIEVTTPGVVVSADASPNEQMAAEADTTTSDLAAPDASAPEAPAPKSNPEPTRSKKTKEELMEQARNYVCTECSSQVPSGHKFCGACGASVPEELQELREEYFGQMQAPGTARLILIRGGDGVDGLSYLLQGTDHVAGRQDAQILFPADDWLSARHANFFYREKDLMVRDEGSTNGVYVRVRGTVGMEPGDQFLCGEQVFRLDPTPKDTSGPDPDQTYFYSSPKRPSPFRLVSIIEGGVDGMVACARDTRAVIGREDADLNFPEDIYMSGRHASVEAKDGGFFLTDEDSRNGTYLRIKKEQELGQGDYVFLGRQLFRVEMTG